MYGLLLQPPSLEDYNGKLQKYKIIIDQREDILGADVSQHTIPVPSENQTLSISAETSYGASPPAHVPLRHSGAPILYSKYENDKPAVQKERVKKALWSIFFLVSNCLGEPGPDLKVFPAANGSAVLVSWSWPQSKHWPTAGGELLHYVLEWTSIPEAQLQWQILAKDQNSTSVKGLSDTHTYCTLKCVMGSLRVEQCPLVDSLCLWVNMMALWQGNVLLLCVVSGLTAGVRYNLSMYAVTTLGVSAPLSCLVYSKELSKTHTHKPVPYHLFPQNVSSTLQSCLVCESQSHSLVPSCQCWSISMDRSTSNGKNCL